MKRKTKGKWILLFSAIASACLFAGCAERLTKEDIFDKYELTSQVTYYANGGEFENRQTTKQMGYKDGSRVLNLGVDVVTSNDKVSISYTEHTIIGWYEVEMKDGKPVYLDETKGIVKLTDNAVSFDEAIQSGEEWHIGMKWKEYAKIHFELVCEDPAERIAVDDKTYADGDIVKTRSFYYKAWKEINVEPFKADDNSHTFLSYYYDKACTQPVTTEITEQETDLTLYAKYLTGNWSIVKNKNDFQAAFVNMGKPMGKNAAGIYLTSDIDCTGLTFSPIANFQNKFKGNGYTISNMTLQEMKISAGRTVSTFGAIKSATVIENVTFENLKLELSSIRNATFKAYYVFSSLDENATINNVSVSGTMKVTTADNSYVSNLENGYTNYKFGGYTTDDEYTGITVDYTGNPEDIVE